MTDYDVVIVGGRCAGSPLGTLLARAGLRVAVVEKAAFPSDTLSTHMFQAPAINFLRRLGVLDKALATGARPNTVLNFRRDDYIHHQPFQGRPGDVGGIMSVRRFVLDPLLAEAAREAGADVLLETAVTGLIERDGRVAGVRIKGEGGERELTARLVVGADGRTSVVARETGARKYHVAPGERFAYWGFFEGAAPEPDPTIVFHLWDGRGVIACNSDSGLYQVIVIPGNQFLPEFRADLEGAFMAHLRECEPVAKLLEGATRVGKFRGLIKFESYFREASGPGWVLVGDAGQFKDPTPGQGMTDAFRQTEALAPAIVRGLAGPDEGLDAAMAEWGVWRDGDAFEHHWLCIDTGAPGAAPSVIPQMIQRADDRGRASDFIDLFQHRSFPSKVTTPGRLIGSAASLARRRGTNRRQLLSDVRLLVGTELQRQKLRKKPVYVEPAARRGAAESEVQEAVIA